MIKQMFNILKGLDASNPGERINRSKRIEKENLLHYINEQQWENYHKELLKGKWRNVSENKDQVALQVREHIDLTLNEIKETIETLKNKKAAGTETELLKYGSEKLQLTWQNISILLYAHISYIFLLLHRRPTWTL